MSQQLKMLPLCLVIYLVIHFPHFKITMTTNMCLDFLCLHKLRERRKDTEWKTMSCAAVKSSLTIT